MAKKQTRRSISVSRATYERLKAFCEANNVSMSQLVETRVNDFLGEGSPDLGTMARRPTPVPSPMQPRPVVPIPPIKTSSSSSEMSSAPQRPSAPAIPMTSAAARFAVEPPPPIIKQKQQEAAPKPTEKRPDQIFTF